MSPVVTGRVCRQQNPAHSCRPWELYGATAQQHWKRWLPERYSALEDPTEFFAALGNEIAARVDELSHALAGDDPAGEGYSQKVGRLNMAKFDAEAQALRELALLDPEYEEDEEDERVHAGVSAKIVFADTPGPIFSPFSGKSADPEEGDHSGDPTLLLVHSGVAGDDYDYCSSRVRHLVPEAQAMTLEQLAASLTMPGAVLFVVDRGWNGITYYAFAPAGE